MTGSEKGDHQNVARAAMVINALAASKKDGLRLTDLVESTGLGVATIHRLLAGLTANGFIDQDVESNRYFIGLKMLSWAANATERYALYDFVDDHLTQICEETEDMVYFSLISGVESVCVDRREGAYPIKTLSLNVGDRRPLGVGAGSMAIFANQPQAFIDNVMANYRPMRDKYPLGDDYIISEIAPTRERGYGLVAGTLVPGMSGIGVPICRPNGRAIGAISVAAISQRMSGERLEQIIALLKSEIAEIEKEAADVLSSPFSKKQSTRKGI